MNENTGSSARDRNWPVDEMFHLDNKWKGRHFISITGSKAKCMGTQNAGMGGRWW